MGLLVRVAALTERQSDDIWLKRFALDPLIVRQLIGRSSVVGIV